MGDPSGLDFGDLVDAAPDGIVVCDAAGTIRLVNVQAERMFGYSRDELIGKPIETLIPERARARHPHHVAAYTAAPRTRPMGSGLELTGRRRDGTELPVEISLSPTGPAHRQLVAAAIRDVSDRRRIEDELRRARAQAEAASAAKSEFLASMSHELRTPLSAVLGFAQLLHRDRKHPLTDRQRERVEHVLRGGEHLLRLIDDVLDLSRIEAGGVAISLESVSVGPVIDEVVSALEPMAARAGAALIDDAPAVPRVVADRTRLAQILMNFGSNAIKYSPAGSQVTFAAAAVDSAVRLSVIDTGPGIPEDKRGRIFEPFYRAGQEAGPIEGTGIGLAISKRLAALMKASIGFESELGRGSTFWIEIPLAPAEDSVAPAAPPPPAAPAPPPDPQREVIYVEDNPSNIAFMREAMSDLSRLALITAPTAEIGLELIRARRPALVILDINLPGMDGFEAAQRLKAWPETRDIPLIALSAAALSRDRVRALEAGFDRYLTKPIQIDELAALFDLLLPPE